MLKSSVVCFSVVLCCLVSCVLRVLEISDCVLRANWMDRFAKVEDVHRRKMRSNDKLKWTNFYECVVRNSRTD